MLLQAKAGKEGLGETARSFPGPVTIRLIPALDLFYDQTKERIVPFITWRISLFQLLTRINLTGLQINTTLSQAALERRLAAAETTHLELEMLLRVHDTMIEHLEADHRWLAEPRTGRENGKEASIQGTRGRKGEWRKLSPPFC